MEKNEKIRAEINKIFDSLLQLQNIIDEEEKPVSLEEKLNDFGNDAVNFIKEINGNPHEWQGRSIFYGWNTKGFLQAPNKTPESYIEFTQVLFPEDEKSDNEIKRFALERFNDKSSPSYHNEEDYEMAANGFIKDKPKETRKPTGNYLAPFNMFEGIIKKGDVFINKCGSYFPLDNREISKHGIFFPIEWVEKYWEPEYEPKIREHELKTVNPFFEQVLNDVKCFELRRNDRDFKLGDKVKLMEYCKEKCTYSGRKVDAKITYLLENYSGIEKDYCIFGFTKI